MKNGERLFVITIGIFLAIIVCQSFTMPIKAEYTIGPGFVPLICALAGLITCAVIFIQGRHAPSSQITIRHSLLQLIKSQAFFRVVFMAISIVALIIAMHFLGMLLPTLLFIVFTVHFIDKYSWWTCVKVSFVTVIVLYLIFEVWLRVQLPHLFF
jgi:hypothetical protein